MEKYTNLKRSEKSSKTVPAKSILKETSQTLPKGKVPPKSLITEFMLILFKNFKNYNSINQ